MAQRFSKNGVPLGRVGRESNKNKSWTKEEDNYLAMVLEQGTNSASQVASRLGRTKNSIYFRKITLGLGGSFARDKRKKSHERKSRLVQPSQTLSVQAPKGLQIMVLEDNIPMPGKNRLKNQEERNQLRKIFEQMNVGQSFAVPRNLVHVAKHLANKEFEAYKIRTSCISVDKKFFRIYRVA